MSVGFDGGRLDIAGLAYLSGQHYPLPALGFITRAMPSCGAVPMHVCASGHIAVPLHDSDALWFGLDPAPGAALSARGVLDTARHGSLDIVSGHSWNPLDWGELAVTGAAFLDGIARDGGGTWPFARHPPDPQAPASRRLHLYLYLAAEGAGTPTGIRISVIFVRPAAYQRLTGTDPGPPADPAHRFGDYLLP